MNTRVLTSTIAVGALLAACSVAPVVPTASPSPEAPANPPVAAAAVTPSPAAATALPTGPLSPAASESPTPSPSPSVRHSHSRDRVLYRDAAFGVVVRTFDYTATGSEEEGYTGQASMRIQPNAGAPEVTVTFDETDRPDSASGDETYDSVEVTDTATGNRRLYEADQGFGNFRVSMPLPMVYRVKQVEGEGEGGLPPLMGFGTLSVQALGGGMYLVDDRECPLALPDAARACLMNPAINGASLAGLTGLFVIMRERPASDVSIGVAALYRQLHGLPPKGTRFPPMPNFNKTAVKGSGFGKYHLLADEAAALNPAAALMREIIELRRAPDYDPDQAYELPYCEPVTE